MATVQLPERCYSMDAAYPLLAVGTAGRHLLSYDLRQPTVPYQARTNATRTPGQLLTYMLNRQYYPQ